MISMPRRYLFFALICLIPAFTQPPAEHITPGTILIASEKLADPHFAASVILITRQDPRQSLPPNARLHRSHL